VCRQLLQEEPRSLPLGPRPPRPRELSARLDEYVIGQERAKRILTVAVYNHMKRVAARGLTGEVELTKGNILLLGPPGTGKTLLARALARILDVPFAIADATPLTQAGYVGEDVESIIGKLLRSAGNDASRAERGIIYIDEVDKLARRVGHDRDVSGEGVQQGLLKILEGKRVQIRIGGDRATGLGSEIVEVDTTNILFVAGGAFEGMSKQIVRRKKDSGVGFQAEGKGVPDSHYEGLKDATAEDLTGYGFLPEFVGRFPVRVALDSLDERSLIRILTEPRDALVRQYQRMFSMEGARLDFTYDGLAAIAQKALNRDTGARALRSVIEEILLDAMFELPNHGGGVWRVDAQAVKTGLQAPLASRSSTAA